MMMLLVAVRLAASTLGLAPLGACATVQPGHAPAVQSAGADEAAPIETADELLAALESAGEAIRRLSADIGYEKTFAIQGDTQIRSGKIVFESLPGETGSAPARRFGITFDRLQVGERVEDEEIEYLEQIIFDGEWLAEVHPLEKQFIRRQVVAPGERWDPLRVGEGPFPIPIQQKRQDILARFVAELVEGVEALEAPKLQAVAQKSYQLKLTPREDAGEQELREIRIWYDKETLLPRIARTVNRAEDVSLVMLKNMRLNEEAEVSEAELSTQPPADLHGWTFSQEEFRGGE